MKESRHPNYKKKIVEKKPEENTHLKTKLGYKIFWKYELPFINEHHTFDIQRGNGELILPHERSKIDYLPKNYYECETYKALLIQFYYQTFINLRA